MIARGFKSVMWVATVGAAALGCYMVSLKVATERAELAKLERQIVAAKQDIRSLQTELGTRGRLSQLEQWNAEVLALSAPSSAQFLQDELTLARFEQRVPTLDERSAEVQLAAAPAAPAAPAPAVPVVQASAPAPAAAALPVHRASVAEAARLPLKTAPVAAPAPVAKAPAAAAPAPKKAEKPTLAAAPKPKAEAPRPSRLDDLVAEVRSGDADAGGGN